MYVGQKKTTAACIVHGESNSDFLIKYRILYDWKMKTSLEQQTILMFHFLQTKDNKKVFSTATWKLEPGRH